MPYFRNYQFLYAGQKRVHVTLTSVEGCNVTIDGDVSYTIFPPAITGLTGTVTFSGNPSCPSGTLTFKKASASLSPSTDLLVTLNSCQLLRGVTEHLMY